MRAERVGIQVNLPDRRLRPDEVTVPGRPHVQRAAPADDQVGVADQLRSERRSEPARDVERPGAAVEEPFRDSTRREQRPAHLAEFEQRLARSEGTRAAPGDEYRALRVGQRVDELGQSSGVGCRLWPARLR
jgi:hypothetical protein